MAAIFLQDLIDAMQAGEDPASDHKWWIDRETGGAYFVDMGLVRAAEEPDPDDAECAIAYALFTDFQRFLRPPGKEEIGEWSIMESFAIESCTGSAQRDLLKALSGKGAFRRFKDEARSLGVEKAWYEYRDAEFREIAIQWCKDEGLEYREGRSC